MHYYTHDNTELAERTVQHHAVSPTPTMFGTFAEEWFAEMAITWRHNTRRNVRSVMDAWLLPRFSEQAIQCISRSDVLKFRAWLGTQAGRKSQNLGNARINMVMRTLKMILNEASIRLGVVDPTQGIPRLKEHLKPAEPFSVEEVQQIIQAAPPKFRNYLIVRLNTGLRSAELTGLKWKHIDFKRREILIRETFQRGRTEYTKNDHSQREIGMVEPVYQALKDQQTQAQGSSDYVFCSRAGTPINVENFRNRVWNPLLDSLGLERRALHQCRHTAATLMLGAGENPWWIAQQMGHSTTEMLFRVYSRYVPNLTRRDGSAFERLLTANPQPQLEIPHE